MLKQRYRRRSRYSPDGGFTLVELALVLAIMAILAAALTPILSNTIDDARITKAAGDTESIAQAIRNFNETTGYWPIFKSGVAITTSSAMFRTLLSPGDDPAQIAGIGNWLPGPGNRGDLDEILGRNLPEYSTTGSFRWRGPYATSIFSDPWGNTYLVNARAMGFGVFRAGFVVSAGPNGTIETRYNQNMSSGSNPVQVGGDDIAARIR